MPTSLNFNIDNRGSQPLEVEGLNLAGIDADQFAIVSPAVPFTVAAGDTELVTVNFTGTTTGTKEAELLVISNDADESTCIVNLIAVGSSDLPDMEITHEGNVLECGSGSVIFSSAYLESDQQDIVIANNGTTTLNITDLVLGVGTDFSIFAAPSLPIMIAPGSTATITLDFTPTNIATFLDTLLIESDDPDNPNCIIDLIGEGSGPLNDAELEVSFEGNVLTCGVSEVNVFSDTFNTGSATIVVSNVGTDILYVNSAVLQGADSVYFTLVAPIAGDFPIEVPPGGTADLDIVIDFNPVAAGNRAADLIIASNDLDENPCIITIKGQVTDDTDAPEIIIVDENGGLQECGYTLDFGDQVALSTTQLTIAVENIGALPLDITSLPITGVAAGAFTLISPTAFPITINSGASEDIILEFSGSVVGVYDALLTVNNTDADESACEINLKGSIATPRNPELQLEDDTATDQDCGYTIDFGQINVGDTNPAITFKIKNLGLAKLEVMTMHISGVGAGAYSFTTIPSTPFEVDELSGEETIEITYDPTVVGFGIHNALVNINNNDSDEDPCTIILVGEYIDPGTTGTPELQIFKDTTEYFCGDTYDMGQTPQNVLLEDRLLLTNSGTNNLIINGLTTTGDNTEGDGITASVGTLPLYIPAGSSSYLNLELLSPNVGTYSIDVTIVNNDTDESNCVLTIIGEVIGATTTPDIQIENGLKTRTYECGDVIRMDDTSEGINVGQDFALHLTNIGTAVLNLDSDPYFTGAASAQFNFIWVSQSVINAGESVPATVRFNPSGLAYGTYTATLNIESDDPDEDPCLIDFTIIVRGQDVVVVDINMDVVDCKEANPPGFVLDLGDVSVNSTVSGLFYIKNLGNTTAIISTVELVNAGTDFSINPEVDGVPTGVLINQDQTLAINVSITPLTVGEQTNEVYMETNDLDFFPCTITVRANGLEVAAPEMEITNSGVVVECDGVIDYGEIDIGNTTGQQTVSIKNVGGAILQLTDMTFVGGDSGQFSLVGNPTFPNNILEDTANNFIIAFDTTGLALGTYSTTLVIESNDADENPCNITLIVEVVDNDPEVNYPFVCGGQYPVDMMVLEVTDPIQEDTFTLINTGNGDWIINGLNISGSPEHVITFDPNPTSYPLTIPPNGSLDITVTFDPNGLTLGTYATTLEIDSNEPTNPLCEITFTHIIVDPTLVPEVQYEFEGNNVECGDSITLSAITLDQGVQAYSFAINNIGTGDLTFTSATFNVPEFDSSPSMFPYTIAPGSDLNYNITFTPPAVGTYVAAYTLVTDDDDESNCVITFTIVVNAPSEGEIELQDNDNNVINCGDTLDLGTYAVGEVIDRQFTLLKIFNVGTGDLDISGATFGGPDAALFGFAPVGFTPPLTINPGNNAVALVGFDAHLATTVKVYNATLTLDTNDADENPCVLNLTAEIIDPSQPEINLVIDYTTANTPVNCGDIIVLDPAFTNDGIQGELIGISNSGNADLEIIDVILGGPDAASFTMTDFGWPLTIAPSDSPIAQGLSIDPNAVGAGTYTCTITYVSDDPVNTLCVLTFTVTIGTPTIQNIQLYDETLVNPVGCGAYVLDFGDVDITDSSDLTIRVENTGLIDLDITGIVIAPLVGGNYTHNGTPQVLTPGQTLDITITFDPIIAGVSTGILQITSDDPDDPLCTMNLTGNAVAEPEIQLEYPELTPQACGFTIDMGQTDVGVPTSTTFAVSNVGTATLDVTNITSSDPQFTVSITSFMVGLGSANQLITVTYTPTSVGLHSGFLTIFNNDLDEGNCIVNLNGEGIVGTAPEIQIKDGAVNYACGALTKDIGQVEIGDTGTTTFIVENTGTGNLNVSSIASSNPNFTVAPSVFNIMAGSTITVVVTYTPTGVGTESTVLTITNDDADEGSCTVNIDGEGIAASPEIQLRDGSTPVACGGFTYTYGTINVGGSSSYTMNIQNLGLGPLNISSITSSNPAFSIVPTNLTIAAGTDSNVVVFWNPTSAGYQSATITVNSNDANEATCTFDVEGTATGVPELQLLNMSNNPVICGVHTLNWVGMASGASSNQQFQIRNDGSTDLTITNITTSDGSWVASPTSFTLNPTNTQIITVTYTAGNRGDYTGTLNIFSNDADENPCVVNLDASVDGPEIQLEDNSTAQQYACGAETFNLGIVGINNSNQYVLEIDNDGELPLNISSITSTGSGDFTVNPSTLTIPAGGEQDITITFAPTSLGTKNATFVINSNDYDEPTCSFNVTGIGSGAAELQLENQFGTDIPCGTGTVIDFGNVTNNTTTTFTIAVENIGNADLIVNNINVSGDEASAFNVLTTNFTVSSGAKQQVGIQVTPEFVGVHTTTLTISSNDSDENPCEVTLQFGVATNPELQLLDESLNAANCGATLFNFNSISVGGSDSGFFGVRNDGTTVLTITAVTSNEPKITINPPSSYPISINPGDQKIFGLNYVPTEQGTDNAIITIINDDSDEGNCTFNVNANAVAPIIRAVDQTTFNTIPCGTGTVNLGNVDITGGVIRGIAIFNDGSQTLNINSILSSNSDFIVGNPASNTVTPGLLTTFQVNLQANELGNQSTTISINTNDPVTPVCTFTITANVTNADIIRIVDEDSGNSTIPCGSTYDFGQHVVGSPITANWKIENLAAGNITWSATITGSDAFAFSVSPNSGSLVGEGSTSLDITYNPTNEQVRTATITFTPTHASGFNPCSITITGEGVALEPQFVLLDDNDTEVTCGSFLLDLGDANTGNTISSIFKVRNDGTADLTTVVGLTLSPPFNISPVGTVNITPGSTQTFTVTYDASNYTPPITSNIVFTTNDPNLGSCTVTAQAATNASELQLFNNSTEIFCNHPFDFGTVTTGSSASEDIVLKNIGNRNLEITGFGQTHGSMSWSPTAGLPYIIPPNSEITVTLTFAPISAVAINGFAAIYTNDPSEGNCGFAVSGMGT